MDKKWIWPSLAGAPPEQQVALARIAEEAAEVTKEAMKALRFGAAHAYPPDGPTNLQKIVSEFHDLTSAIIAAFGIEPLLRADPDDPILNAERRMVNRAGALLGFEKMSYDQLLVQAEKFISDKESRSADTPAFALALIEHLSRCLCEVMATNMQITALLDCARSVERKPAPAICDECFDILCTRCQDALAAAGPTKPLR